tara:strand:- start:44471 stop:45388 length:918 start_codon:yes stop_codon:yes gene_type:complete
MKPKLYLAPMAGVNNIAFRLLCKKYGCDILSTEMISAHALSRNNKATIGMIKTISKEKPISVQLFGLNVKYIVKSVKLVEDNFDYIDFNLGCPAPKVFNQGMGAALLKRPAKIKEIIEKLVKNTNVPVTAKIRAGISEKKLVHTKIAKIIEKAGASAIAIHARTSKQGYSGTANWDWIKEVKESVNIPVVGNGDVFLPEDAIKMLEHTGCDHIMVGRAAIGNPFIFKQIKDKLSNKKIKQLTLKDRKKMFVDWYKLYTKHSEPKLPVLRNNAQWFTKSIENSKKIRHKISFAKNQDEIINIIKEI